MNFKVYELYPQLFYFNWREPIVMELPKSWWWGGRVNKIVPVDLNICQ